MPTRPMQILRLLAWLSLLFCFSKISVALGFWIVCLDYTFDGVCLTERFHSLTNVRTSSREAKFTSFVAIKSWFSRLSDVPLLSHVARDTLNRGEFYFMHCCWKSMQDVESARNTNSFVAGTRAVNRGWKNGIVDDGEPLSILFLWNKIPRRNKREGGSSCGYQIGSSTWAYN